VKVLVQGAVGNQHFEPSTEGYLHPEPATGANLDLASALEGTIKLDQGTASSDEFFEPTFDLNNVSSMISIFCRGEKTYFYFLFNSQFWSCISRLLHFPLPIF
jgi:hypothetical protein